MSLPLTARDPQSGNQLTIWWRHHADTVQLRVSEGPTTIIIDLEPDDALEMATYMRNAAEAAAANLERNRGQ